MGKGRSRGRLRSTAALHNYCYLRVAVLCYKIHPNRPACLPDCCNLQLVFDLLFQPSRFRQQAHAVHQVLQGDDAHQPLLIDHGNQSQAAGGQLAERRGQRFAARGNLKRLVHGALDVTVAFAAQSLDDDLTVDHANQIATTHYRKIILQAMHGLAEGVFQRVRGRERGEVEDALSKAVHSLQDDFPVVSGSDLVGVINRQIIVERLRREGNGYVQGAMNKAFEIASRGESLASAFRKLTTRGLTLIPVVDQERLVGIVTLQNLMHSMGLLADSRRLKKQVEDQL